MEKKEGKGIHDRGPLGAFQYDPGLLCEDLINGIKVYKNCRFFHIRRKRISITFYEFQKVIKVTTVCFLHIAKDFALHFCLFSEYLQLELFIVLFRFSYESMR